MVLCKLLRGSYHCLTDCCKADRCQNPVLECNCYPEMYMYDESTWITVRHGKQTKQYLLTESTGILYHKITTWIVGFIWTHNYPWSCDTIWLITLLLHEASATHEHHFLPIFNHFLHLFQPLFAPFLFFQVSSGKVQNSAYECTRFIHEDNKILVNTWYLGI